MRESGSTSSRAAPRRRTSCARSQPPERPPSRPCAPTCSSAGRGRRGRRWEAPAGHGAARLDPAAARSGRRTSCRRSASPAVSPPSSARAAFGAAARLSWPNDVVCEGRKLGGVLAELGPDGERPARRRHEPRRRRPPISRRPTASSRPRCCSRRDPHPTAPDGAGGAARGAAAAGCGLRRARGPRRSRRAPVRSTRSRARAVQLRLASGDELRARRPASPTTAACSYAAPTACAPTRAARSCG